MTTDHTPPTDQPAEIERLRTENERMRHELKVMYGGAFDTPPADQTALRDRIAAAIWERQNPGRRWTDCEYRWRADAEEDADAVLAELPPPADRAAEERNRYRTAWRSARERAQAYGEGILLHVAQRDFWQMAAGQNHAAGEAHRFALSEALGLGSGAPWDAIHERVKELRRMADETQPDQAEARAEVDVDTLARLLCDADVHVNDGDYPGWDDLSKTPGLGQDEVRKAARYLMARLHITLRSEARQDGAQP